MNGAPIATAAEPLLRVTDLSVTLYTASATVRAVDCVNYSVDAGEVLAIVGESGSGKTICNLAPLGLLPSGVTVDLAGRVEFRGVDLLKASEPSLQKIRGGEIAVIFQDPLSALNPVRRIGPQISEVCERHLNMSSAAADRRMQELLTLVGIPDPVSRMRQYPHELQRICIARSLAAGPRVLICDEPVSSLDVSIRAQIMNLFLTLRDEFGLACLLIAHDLAIVRQAAGRVYVMYLGKIMEVGDSGGVYDAPSHPYTGHPDSRAPCVR
jgi:peptide/nickel transport system ATP-binding protein